jgi:hypothetical protein
MNREIANIVNRVLSEEISGRIKDVKNKIFETNNMKKEICSECGSKEMYEGECTECGANPMTEGQMCSECGGNMVEGECTECGTMYGGDIQELGGMEDEHPKKYGKLRKIMSPEEIEYLLRGDKEEDKGDDFPTKPGFVEKRMKQMSHHSNRKHNDGEIDERLYGNQKRIDKNKNGRIDREDFKMLRKEMYELTLDGTDRKFVFSENEIIDIIENIVLEEKKKSKSKSKPKNPIKLTKANQDKSKKENDDYIDSVVKKMKDHLKGGSKGEYDMNPKHFPKGNGELAKMDKMAYIPSDAVAEYITNFTAASLENIDYDGIHPNEKWVTDNVVGSSRTGNNPEWANAVETPNNKLRNQIRKDNLLAKMKRKAYNKSPQPIVNDSTGSESDKTSKIMMKLESESERKVIGDIEKMKTLITYGKKTQ